MTAPFSGTLWQPIQQLSIDILGETWRVKHQETDEIGVFKYIRRTHAFDGVLQELFDAEVRDFSEGAHHPNQAVLLDHSPRDSEVLWFVTRLVGHTELSTYVEAKQELGNAELAALCQQAGHILEVSHRRGYPYVNRLIQPKHFVEGEDQVFFFKDIGNLEQGLMLRGLLAPAEKAAYIAPYMFSDGPSLSNDFYSLGVTLASLATGIAAEELPWSQGRLNLDDVLRRSPFLPLLNKLTQPVASQRVTSFEEYYALIPTKGGNVRPKTGPEELPYYVGVTLKGQTPREREDVSFGMIVMRLLFGPLVGIVLAIRKAFKQ